jgi:hypothetical protein
MKYYKIIAIAACALALVFVVYRTYTASQQDKARLESDQQVIMNMVEEKNKKQ